MFAGVEEGNTGFSLEIQEKIHEVYGGMEKSVIFSSVCKRVGGEGAGEFRAGGC